MDQAHKDRLEELKAKIPLTSDEQKELEMIEAYAASFEPKVEEPPKKRDRKKKE